MKNIILSFCTVIAWLCFCSCQNNSTDVCNNEMDTLRFHPQFIKIVKEYVETHPEYDSYIVSSQFVLTKHLKHEFEYNSAHKYYITPATYRYHIELSPDSVYTFDCFADEYLSSYMIINSKKVFLSSDIDELSKTRYYENSIPHLIEAKKSGGIWCFATKNDKYYIVSKDVERHESLWPGIIEIKSTVKFSAP